MRALALVAPVAVVAGLACEPPLHVYGVEPSGAGGAASSSSVGGSVVGHGTGVVGVGGSTGTGATCGFSTPTDFALPTGYRTGSTAGAFPILSGSASCSNGADLPSYALADLDGDGKVDLVVTSQCSHPEVGTSVWWWFKSTGSGFASTAATWALPSGFPTSTPSFPALDGQVACQGSTGKPAFTLADMDGDGRLDLLVTRACSNPEVGATTWWYFKNTGTGFAPTQTMISLPAGFSTTEPPFPGISGALDCAAGADLPAYALFDATGDGVVDLVVTASCTDVSVGASRWLVYAGGSGFSHAPLAWTLPSGFGSGAVFGDTGGALDCAAGASAPAYVVGYVNADAFPDLLVTRSCADSTAGTTHWLLYPGSSSGFAATSTRLSLPAGYGTTAKPPFGSANGALSCFGGVGPPSFLLVDMNADGRLDLLVTQRCNDTTTGTTEWLLYAGGADGFAASTAVTLPSGYHVPAGGTPVFASTSGALACSPSAVEPTFYLLDLDGDARPDLVITSRCDDTTTGASRWLLDSSTCG